MRRGGHLAALAGLLVSTFAVPARAEDGEDIEALLDESVVSGASKSAESASDAPATVVTLSGADMNRFGMRTLAEAINFLGMGLVTQDPLHSVEVGGRGVLLTSDFGNHVLVVVDGHALNEGWDGTTYFEQGLAIPMEIIDHVELILGPGSVLYGGNAMLGVINVVTKRARSYRGLHAVAEGGLSPQQSGGAFTSFRPSDLGTSYRLGAGVGHELQLFGANAEVTAQLEYYDQNGPPFRWGPQPALNPSGAPADYGPKTPLGTWGGVTRAQYGTQVPSGYARVIVGDLTLSLRAATYRRTTPYVNGFNQSAANFDDPSSYELDRWLSADLQYRKAVTSKLSIMARAYGDSYDYQQRTTIQDSSYCALPVSGACGQRALGVSRWAGLELQGTYDWLGNGALATMLGTDARVRYVGAKTDITDGATNTPVGSQAASEKTDVPVGVYLQQKWSPFKVLHLNAGARFDSDPRGGQRLSPRAAAVVEVWKGGALKSSYAEAFRAPANYEFTYQAADQAPNPGLKAETVRGVEASFEQRFGAHRVMFGVFRSWWNDMIQLVLLPDGVYQFQNVSTIDNYGYNGAFEGKNGAFMYGGSLTGAHTRRQTATGAEPLVVAPQVYGNARIAYDLPGEWPVVAVAASFVGTRLADRALDGGFPTMPTSPAALGLRATFSGDVPNVKGLSYRLAGDYSTATTVPYVAGPNQAADPANPRNAELAPVNRMTVFATFRYDFAF
jgi:outer membrane receptor for ferrienterochelin and colicins